MEWSGASWWSLVSGERAGGSGCVWVCVRGGGCVLGGWTCGNECAYVCEKGKRTKREDVSGWVVVGGGGGVVLGCCWSGGWWIGGVGPVGGFILCGSEALITRLALIFVFCTCKLCS